MPAPLFAPPRHGFTQPFWDGVAAGELRLPRCSACQAWQWYPMPGVDHCAGARIEWTPVRPDGRIFTFTTVRRPFLPDASTADVPFTTVLVELDDAPGIRLVGRLVDDVEPTIGMRVTAEFANDTDGADVRVKPSDG
jgi:uncharacterized OB-fold protein